MLVCYWLFITQIVGESFPISSSGHVKLIELFLEHFPLLYATSCLATFCCAAITHDLLVVQEFDHLMQGPTVLIIAIFFYPRWSLLIRHGIRFWRKIVKIWLCVGIADIITALLYISGIRLLTSPFLLGIGFFITALVLYSLRYCSRGTIKPFTSSTAIIVGCVQGLALLPGISRLATTYTAARWLRYTPRQALEMSLLIQWPLITAAWLKAVYIVGFARLQEQFLNLEMGLIMLGATILAWFGLRVVVFMSETYRLWWFSYYMIVPLIVWAWLMFT